MKAKILDLDNTYYSTTILLSLANGDEVSFEICYRKDFNPSIRELERLNCNEYPSGCKDCEGDCFCDGHYETQETYDLALKLVEIINKYGKEV